MHESRYDFDDRVWWCTALQDLSRLLLNRVSLPDNASALDVGCGPGVSLNMLSEYATRVVGMDISPQAIEHARRRCPSAELRVGDANAISESFTDATFDLVTMFGMLYHRWVRDVPSVLRQAWQTLKPGGVILVTDPAFDSLRRRCDRVMMTERRFRMSQTRQLLQTSGFEVISGTYFYMACFFPAYVMAVCDRRRAGQDDEKPVWELGMPPFPLNAGMKLMMACERTLIRIFGSVPLGVQLACLARKP